MLHSLCPISFLSALSFDMFPLVYLLILRVTCSLLLFYPLSLVLCLPLNYFPVPSSEIIGKSANDGGLKTEHLVVVYEVWEGSTKVVSCVTIIGVGLTNPDESQHLLHDVSLNRRLRSDLIDIEAAVVQKGSSPIPYPYESHWTLMEIFPETLENVSKYGSCVWDSEAVKAIGKMGTESSSMNTFEKDWKIAES